MAKFISNDLKIYISQSGGATLDLVPTAITKAAPAEVTVASTTGLAEGDPVYVSGTEYGEIDGKMFVASNITGTTFELLGSDTTNSAAAALGTTPVVNAYVAGIMDKICLREFNVAEGSTSEIDAGTFCEEASLPGPTTPGSITVIGYVDITSAAYTALKAAADDSLERTIALAGPEDQYWVGRVKFSTLSWAFPRGDVVTFTATATQTKPLNHVF